MKLQRVQITAAGRWNPRIFVPAWLSQYLFIPSDEHPLQGLINPETNEMAFTHKGVILLVKESTLEISFTNDEATDDSLRYGNSILRRILDLLPHTPVTNIAYSYTFNGEPGQSMKEYAQQIFALPPYETTSVVAVRLRRSSEGMNWSVSLSPPNADGMRVVVNISPLSPDRVRDSDAIENLQLATSFLQGNE